jgi:acid phosphatase (class A)
MAAPRFPRNGWNLDLLALSILGEFAKQDWRGRIKIAAPPPHADARTLQEVNDLVALARTERGRRFAEIIDQDLNFHDYFAHLLMIMPQSHFETFVLFKAGARVAEMLMVSYKLVYERARPQQIYPRLLPVFDAPGHSSYPSGHALISRMIALCLADVAPQARSALIALSERIGHNREIAGMHFRSDTMAGFEIAEQAFPLLQACTGYQDILARAQREWS